jgi:flagellar motility protein MotE (MotC chaperone)
MTMDATQAFAYAFALKAGDQGERILSLLDNEKQSLVKAAIQELRESQVAGIRKQWQDQRKREEDVLREQAMRKQQLTDQRLPPALVDWLLRTC